MRLGRFAGMPGLESMVVLGQYGVERWDARTGEFTVPPEPEEITRVAEELPAVLSSLGLADARVEHKGRAIGVHTRELDGAGEAFEQLVQPLTELAERHHLQIEPGKNVLEIRAPGIDKGDALRQIVAEQGPRQVIFAGDDLGDLPAFRAVEELRSRGDRRPPGLFGLARGGCPDRDVGPDLGRPTWCGGVADPAGPEPLAVGAGALRLGPASHEMNDVDLSEEHLDVYDRGDGPWNPDHGEVDIPADWEFLPSGDAFVTRTVKAAGKLLAGVASAVPQPTSSPARGSVGARRDDRGGQASRPTRPRPSGPSLATTSARSRERAEEKYRQEMEAAILDYLDFAAEHTELAKTIAEEAAARAAVVGSGRVGRTRTISLGERAALAARAHIRHHHTDYEESLADLELAFDDEEEYRWIKRNSQACRRRLPRATSISMIVVVAAAVCDDLEKPTRILAARRRTPAELAGRWELPGGKVEPE